jgi:hypothetical protein
MTDDKAEQLLKESGLAYGMIDKEYRPNMDDPCSSESR